MAAGSKAGATSSHTIKAKGGCLQHNRREYQAPNVVPDRSHLNQSWESEDIKHVKSIRTLERHAAKLYTEKTGQKCQKSFAPFRESVVVVKETSTMSEAKKFADMVEQHIGVKCIGIWIHKDEGYSRSKYIEGDSTFVCNHHVHYLWRSQNQNTGKAIPFKKCELRLMQDLAASAFGMDRGNSAEVTGRSHVEANRYRETKVTERLDNLSAEADRLSTANAVKAEAVSTIKAAGGRLLGVITGKDKLKNDEITRLQHQLKQVQQQLADKTNHADDLQRDVCNLRLDLQKRAQDVSEAHHEARAYRLANDVLHVAEMLQKEGVDLRTSQLLSLYNGTSIRVGDKEYFRQRQVDGSYRITSRRALTKEMDRGLHL